MAQPLNSFLLKNDLKLELKVYFSAINLELILFKPLMVDIALKQILLVYSFVGADIHFRELYTIRRRHKKSQTLEKVFIYQVFIRDVKKIEQLFGFMPLK